MMPIMIDVKDKKVLIVGPGQVGLRKAQAFRAQGAHVTVWDQGESPEMTMPLGEVQGLLAPYDLMVLTTPDQAYNDWLTEIGRGIKLWINRADHATRGDFFTMATVERDFITLALGTGGQVPGLSKALAQAFDVRIPKNLSSQLAGLQQLRALYIKAPMGDRRKIKDELQMKIDALVAYVTDKWPEAD